VNKVQYLDQSGLTGPSKRLWANCPIADMMIDPNVGFHFFDDFLEGPAAAAATATHGWVVTEITSGDIEDAGILGGGLLLTGDTADGDGIQMQGTESWKPTANKRIWFEARVKVSDADDCDFVVGLADVDSTLVASNPNDICAFIITEGSANITFRVDDDGSNVAVDTGADAADDTWVKLGFLIDGTSTVTPYINGVAYTAKAVTSGIPDALLAASIGFLTGAAAEKTATVDWIRVAMER
jgi:hypothetical protein